MHYHVLATDYDGTIAEAGSVSATTLAALQAVKESGRKLILVTGRELRDLLEIFPAVSLFDAVVVENGAQVYRPMVKEVRTLAAAPPTVLIEELERRGVRDFSVGQVIVATAAMHRHSVLEAVRSLGLPYQLIFNKGSLMLLPSGVNKSTGLRVALRELNLSLINTVGVGDAENDHIMLQDTYCSAAVQNAVPALKEIVDVVLPKDAGAGVEFLCENLIATDLVELQDKHRSHRTLIGFEGKEEIAFSSYRSNILIAGPSGSGKSTVTAGLVERLLSTGYQFCLIDPEGDYASFAAAVCLGDAKTPPTMDSVTDLLLDSDKSAIVNLLGCPLSDRPIVCSELLPRLQRLRVECGHPHWLVIDEAHHLLPAAWKQAGLVLPQSMSGTILITVHPEEVAVDVLRQVDIVIAVGPTPEDTLQRFATALGLQVPPFREGAPTESNEASPVVGWFLTANRIRRLLMPRGSVDRKRHKRKYAEGDVREKAFFFEGPERKLKLRVQNLTVFVQIAAGLDDATWEFHLRRGDYSDWIRTAIKDEGLAKEVALVEQSDAAPVRSRQLIAELINRAYTLPA